MVDLLRKFFETNEIVFFFLYGQVFFVIGLAIASQSRQHSRLALLASNPASQSGGITADQFRDMTGATLEFEDKGNLKAVITIIPVDWPRSF